jgi:nucleotide-binding universal stress UspA family protein
MKNILFPTDFSENSNDALTFALNLAKDFRAKLHILNAYKMPYSSSSPMTRTLLETLEKSSLKDLESTLNQIKTSPAYQDLEIKTKAMAGSVANSVDVYANKVGIDLIVMGTKGASGLKEVLIGSNAEEVVTHSDKSDLVVPENTKVSNIKKIAFAIDFQGVSDSSIYNSYINFAKKYNAETCFVNISKDDKPLNETIKGEQQTALEQLFDGINCSFHFEKDEDVVNGINNFVKRNECDMLAVLSRKHGFIEKIFHKSISNKLTCHAELPMFVVKEI